MRKWFQVLHCPAERVGADSPQALVWMITSVDADFTLTSGPPELTDAFRAQAARCLHAVQAT